ncbi:MAG TPA: NAD(P)/FAD-dependent oxidoreductase [Tepidisphaeraceae bacterium]|nr:NAD(P)/FAD-dependent oxidoreductase [Tepidisphaeraceae bacterium]
MSDSPSAKACDVVVIGSGPNGFAAAITLARAGKSVLLLEAKDTVGGGMRSTELTLKGFVHDVCAAIHPLGATSPFFRSLPLKEHGLEFIHPDAPLAHPLEDGRVAMLERSLNATAAALGEDAAAYRNLLAPLSRDPEPLFDELLAPLHIPKHPLRMASFGLRAVRSATGLADAKFKGDLARGLFAGNAAHSFLPLDKPLTAAVGLMLMLSGHAFGWPVARGGSRAIAASLESYLKSVGGEVRTNHPVASMNDLPPARAYLFDVSPRNLARIAGDQLPARFANKLNRYRHGPAAFKLDWALSEPIPWTNPACLRAATVHVGGTIEQIAASERATWGTEPSDRPFVLVGQQSLFDRSRAPGERQQTGWAYCHVPNGYTGDMTQRIEAQVERFAPGFRDTILARHAMRPADFEAYNSNYIGGDITGGVQDAFQLFTRPTARWSPYTTPNPSIYICSASTPPGAGVHGMCGYHAARSALKRAFR